MALITELIEGPDGHEVVTAAIGAALVTEIAEQQVLAVNDGKNPEAWRADVYTNRMKSFDTRVEGDDLAPIINVWFQSGNYEKQGSTVRAMRGDGTWNIDIYGFGKSTRNTDNGGQEAGDKAAKDAADHWLGLVRRILMSAQYTYLGSPRANTGPDPSLLNQFCYGRWVESITAFQPELETRAAITCVGSRVALGVHYLVDSPQLAGTVFEILSSKVYREEDGRLLVALDTDISGSP